VAPEAEAQCRHLSRTDVGKPDSGRQVCDDCKQIFQGGFPVTVIPPVAVVLPVTEAARANKKPAKGNKSTALATATKTDDDKLSSSSAEASLDLAEENKQAAGIAKMSTTELHTEIIQTYQLTGENFITYRLLVLDARRRMHDGEAVGECTTWKDYENRYLKKDGESLPTCMRRVARLLEGINPDTKHKNKRHKKSNRTILEESLDQNERLTKIAAKKEYEKGFADGEKSGEKKMKMLAAKIVASQKKSINTDDDNLSSSTPTPAAPPTTDPAREAPAPVAPPITTPNITVTGKYLPKLEAIYGKGQVKIEDCHEGKFGYRTVRYNRAKVTFLIDLPDLDRFIAKQDGLYAIAPDTVSDERKDNWPALPEPAKVPAATDEEPNEAQVTLAGENTDFSAEEVAAMFAGEEK